MSLTGAEAGRVITETSPVPFHPRKGCSQDSAPVWTGDLSLISPPKIIQERNSASICQERQHQEEGQQGTQRDSAVGRCCSSWARRLLSLHLLLLQPFLPPLRQFLPTVHLHLLLLNLSFSFEAKTETLMRGRPSLIHRGKTQRPRQGAA